MDIHADFGQRLASAVQQKKSAICVGLDPRWSMLPAVFQSTPSHPTYRANAVRDFCLQIIDAVADKVAVLKPQAAFFELLGPEGMRALAEVIAHGISKDLLIILDAKRNDIGSTAEGYAEAYLGRGEKSVWGADALTVSPYLGDDSLQPFVDACDQRQAGIFVLVKTSNPGGGFLQDLVSDQKTIYQRVAGHLESLNQPRKTACGYGPIGAVVGATYREQLAEMRAAMPSTWILVPGFGAQGGSAADVAGGFDARGLGAIINNSRNIIFAHSRKDLAGRFSDARWQDAVVVAVEEMNHQLNAETPAGRLGQTSL